MRPIRALAAVLMLVGLAGCVQFNPAARHSLEAAPNCSTRINDVVLLESNRSGGWTRTSQGLQAILPPAFIISWIRDIAGKPRGLYLDHWKVALGIYNRRITERVKELNSTCRPPDTTN
jgi:hypothetical protein